MVTADLIGGGRFGLNIVCGWNKDEFAMAGVEMNAHEARYEQGQEWVDIVTRPGRRILRSITSESITR